MEVKMRQKVSEKKKVLILFGGCSPEYEVSLQSAYAVITNINRQKYEVITVGITREGQWLLYEGDPEHIQTNSWQKEGCCRAVLCPDKGSRRLLVFRDNEVEELEVDLLFPVLHGKNGEDGTVQGYAALAGISLVGCSVLSSALCMDKERAHLLVKELGIRVPKSVVVTSMEEFFKRREQIIELKIPMFVKPVKAGSSFGITKVGREEELEKAVKEAFCYDDTVIAEEYIEGFEVGCAILGTKGLIIGEVDEIELESGFFDYTEKYTLKTSSIHMPARISEHTKNRVKEAAKAIYRRLDCSGFARVDMFLTKEEELMFNEVNTIPGFTKHSRYPGMLGGIGMSFGDILDRLLEDAG